MENEKKPILLQELAFGCMIMAKVESVEALSANN